MIDTEKERVKCMNETTGKRRKLKQRKERREKKKKKKEGLNNVIK